ncbi:MAG TPA: hypothetical protein VD971_06925 [Phycisphaerales bacterium]|nr:hypothetical protein [Phycisphaerales bacterium]
MGADGGRRVGACGFMLGMIPVQSDGCQVCPECSAAWSEKRFTHTREFIAANVECARCRTRLPGPGRICPRCGVMAGEVPV